MGFAVRGVRGGGGFADNAAGGAGRCRSSFVRLVQVRANERPFNRFEFAISSISSRNIVLSVHVFSQEGSAALCHFYLNISRESVAPPWPA